MSSAAGAVGLASTSDADKSAPTSAESKPVTGKSTTTGALARLAHPARCSSLSAELRCIAELTAAGHKSDAQAQHGDSRSIANKIGSTLYVPSRCVPLI